MTTSHFGWTAVRFSPSSQGGFGVMGWVNALDYEYVVPDPLAGTAPGILAHVNVDHADAMVLLAKIRAEIDATEATMSSVDRVGFSLRLKTKDGFKGARINSYARS